MTIHPIRLGISNAFLVQDKSTILVDTGSEGQYKKLIACLEKFNCSVDKLDFIIITHAHWDHTGNVANLKSLNPNLKVIAHEREATHLISGRNASIRPFGWLGKILAPFFNVSYKGCKPDMIFNDVLPLQKLGMDGYLLHTPGHTEGSCSVILNNNTAIVGDLVMGAPFFPKKPSYHFFVDDYAVNNTSIREVIGKNTSQFYVGHGGVLDVNDVFSEIGKKCIYH